MSLSFSFLLELFIKRSSDDSSQNYPDLPRKLSRNPEINVLHKLPAGLQAFPDGFEKESEEKDSEQSFHNAGTAKLGKKQIQQASRYVTPHTFRDSFHSPLSPLGLEEQTWPRRTKSVWVESYLGHFGDINTRVYIHICTVFNISLAISSQNTRT